MEAVRNSWLNYWHLEYLRAFWFYLGRTYAICLMIYEGKIENICYICILIYLRSKVAGVLQRPNNIEMVLANFHFEVKCRNRAEQV